jgi:hypothetical protein
MTIFLHVQAQEEHLVNMFDSMSRKQADQACTMSKAQDKLVSDGRFAHYIEAGTCIVVFRIWRTTNCMGLW